MKKITILLMALAVMTVSCSNKKKTQPNPAPTRSIAKITKDMEKKYKPSATFSYNNAIDSVNYIMGLVSGAQIKAQQLATDTNLLTAPDLLDGLKEGFNNEPEQLNETQLNALLMASVIKQMRQTGLLLNKEGWTLNENLIFQGVINSIYNDESVITTEYAQDFFQVQYYDTVQYHDTQKPVTSDCMTAKQTVVLNNRIDSLNYAFGYLNATQMFHPYMKQNDQQIAQLAIDFAEAVNETLNSDYINPYLHYSGQQIGAQIKQQTTTGLFGIEKLPVKFDLIYKGFVDGIFVEYTMDDLMQFNIYAQNALDNLQKEEGEKFLKENARRPEVKVTESGLQYEVLQAGEGEVHPTAESTVKVHYHGTLIDGTVFDSSVERGEPFSFPLNGVIKGWTEGVQLMVVGDKFRFYIPYQLGYGERGTGPIPPFATLIFDVELLEIEQ